jgi:hypothetical protein
VISSAEQVYIGKGKNVLNFKPSGNTREEILKLALGRTKNLRAPSLKAKGSLYIGFNESIYDSL